MANVTIYTRQFCGFCTAAKRLLEKKGVSYVEHDATLKPDLKREMIQRSHGGSTFPQIFIGSVHVGGCDELHALVISGANLARVRWRGGFVAGLATRDPYALVFACRFYRRRCGG